MEGIVLLHEFSNTITSTVKLWEKQYRTGASYLELLKLKEELLEGLTKGTKTGDGIPENGRMLLKFLSSMLDRLPPWEERSISSGTKYATCKELEGFGMFYFTPLHGLGAYLGRAGLTTSRKTTH